MKKFFYIALMFAASLFASSASAGYLDDVGASTPSTSAPSAVSAPEAAKPAVVVIDMTKLLRCTKNIGKVALEEQLHPQYQYYLSQNGFSTVLMMPMLRHAVQQSACFSTASRRDVSTTRWSLKVVVQTIGANRSRSAPKAEGLSAVDYIPLVGMITQLRKHNERQNAMAMAEPPKMTVDSIQLSFTVTDLDTGDIIASVVSKVVDKDVTLGDTLLSNAPGALSGEVGQNPTARLVASAYADAMNQLVPYMDKLNASTSAK